MFNNNNNDKQKEICTSAVGDCDGRSSTGNVNGEIGDIIGINLNGNSRGNIHNYDSSPLSSKQYSIY
ncbi:5387_t:CDS:2 [Ambispora leptoticha]|uniref:5387_t:CDS:1 n=1 Tax=Ambispora leptoticha TaxID=144679 RepID=A0A9N9C7U3_9GLOM|nr:5387_t:CDS:2 [Ambispora leptoticha]